VARFLGGAEERTAVSGPARTADAALAVVATIAAVVAVIIQARRSGGPDILFVRPGALPVQLAQVHVPYPSPAILLAAALTTAPLAFRRIYPITAFCVILAAVIATSKNTTSITFAAAIFAAYSAVAYSRFRKLALLSVLAGAFVVTAAYPDTTPPVPERFTALLVLLPTVSVGVAIRVWRGRARESAERLRLAEAEHEAETRLAVEGERARIASEMHDVVTHNVSVMVVQAGAARRVLDSSPDDAREALLAVEASGRTAMTELRHLLGLLAPSGGVEPGPAEVLTPQPDVAQIPALVARLCRAGMPVELSVEAPGGTPPALPAGIDLAAFRVVQEGLTNVMKHAGQARTTVRLDYRPRDLLITVSDDGSPGESAPAAAAGSRVGPRGQAEPASGGRGLIGLRERIAVYGGELDAGPRPGGGWRLAARIPLEPPVAARIPLEPAAAELPVPQAFQEAAAAELPVPQASQGPVDVSAVWS
jgi:signal transduction histidine kinase